MLLLIYTALLLPLHVTSLLLLYCWSTTYCSVNNLLLLYTLLHCSCSVTALGLFYKRIYQISLFKIWYKLFKLWRMIWRHDWSLQLFTQSLKQTHTCTGITEVMVLNPFKAWIFFQALISQLLKVPLTLYPRKTIRFKSKRYQRKEKKFSKWKKKKKENLYGLQSKWLHSKRVLEIGFWSAIFFSITINRENNSFLHVQLANSG